LFDEPMIRDINDLLECERDEIQKMLGDKEKWVNKTDLQTNKTLSSLLWKS